MKTKNSLLSFLGGFLFLISSCENNEKVPEEALKFNPVTAPNEFREAYVSAIILDLRENGENSIYHPGEQGRLDFENTNVFVISRNSDVSVGYVKHPLGPTKVYNLQSGKWRFEE